MRFIKAEGGKGKPTIYYDENGPAFRVTGPRNRRNNNPGNIEYGNFAIKEGAIGTDGRFAIFPDEETGFKAMKDLLKSNSYKNLTIEQAIEKWAPSSENDTDAYLKFIITQTGLNKDLKIYELSEEQLDNLVKAMAKREGYYSKDLNIIPLRPGLSPEDFYRSSISSQINASQNFDFPNPFTYTVRPGDTLSKIAEEYGVSVDDLLKANPWIKNPNHIEVGWKIKIPGYAEKVRSNLAEATRRIDPLVIDLDGDGIELTDIKESKAMFDLTGSGFANLVGWVNFGYNFAQRRVLV